MSDTREAWLERAAGLLYALLPQPGNAPYIPIPPIKLSVGRPKTRKRLGECWGASSSADGSTRHIFIAPRLTIPTLVLATVLHELLHARLPEGVGHRTPFARLARQVGFLPPWAHTPVSDELQVALFDMAVTLGPYPHVGLHEVERKKQRSRMLLWACACTGADSPKVRAAGARVALEAMCLRCKTRFNLVDPKGA